MAVDTSLAQLSNTLVYASMAAYTGSFIAFAASMAAGRGRAEVADQPALAKRESTATKGRAECGQGALRRRRRAGQHPSFRAH